MKVILIKDVARLGRKSEVKDVPSGHAQNFLIPRKLAIPATPENMKRLSAEIAKQSAEREASEQSFHDAILVLASREIPYVAEANEQGHLFKGVNARDIASLLRGEGIAIMEDDIELPHPIKSTGVHEVALARGGEKGVLRLAVVAK